jgi:hypothetical protein
VKIEDRNKEDWQMGNPWWKKAGLTVLAAFVLICFPFASSAKNLVWSTSKGQVDGHKVHRGKIYVARPMIAMSVILDDTIRSNYLYPKGEPTS